MIRRLAAAAALAALVTLIALAAGSPLMTTAAARADSDREAVSQAARIDDRDSWPSAERILMDTLFRVTLRAPDDTRARAAIDAAFGALEHVDSTMSEWNSASPLSRINRMAGISPVAIPADLFELLTISRRVADETGGAFDPTWAALQPLWPFDGTERVPSPEEVAARLPLVGWRDLVLDARACTAYLTRPGMVLGLGGIAKGYALDLAAAELGRRGYHDFLIYAGGQVIASGDKGGGAPWRTGVQDPRGGTDDVFASFDVNDVSVATSGDYQHAFVARGVLYHHIIDLETGYPARRTRSATVIAKTATLADAYDNAAFVLGSERALELAVRLGFELLLVDSAGALHGTEGLRARAIVHHFPAAGDSSTLPSSAR